MGLNLVMCLQVSGDSPSHCFGTIRYISSVESETTQQPMQEKHFLTNVWHIVQDVCPPGNQKSVMSDWFKWLSSHFFSCVGNCQIQTIRMSKQKETN